MHRTARRLLTAGLVITLASVVLVAAPASAATMLADGFEAGNLAAWSGGTGFVAQQTTVHDGSWAGLATSTGAAAHAFKRFTAQPELSSRTWFNVRSRSTALWLVSYRKAGGGGILQVGIDAKGRLMAKNIVTKTTYASSVTVPSSTWHSLDVHARVGTSGSFDVAFDGVPVAALTRNTGLGSVNIGRFGVGDTLANRNFRVAFDDVRVTDAAAPPDETPPTQPTALIATPVDAATVDLAWQPSTDGTGVTGYTIYRSTDGLSYAAVGQSATTSYRDGGLAPATSYWWAVDAVDAAGNRSERSDPATSTTPSDDPASTIGRWSDPVDVGVVGVHAAVLHTGKVLLFYETDVTTRSAVLYEPTSGTVTDVTPSLALQHNMFCSAQTATANGEVFVVGGVGWAGPSGYGTERSTFFDPVSETWRAGPAMSAKRWYPTIATGESGDTLVFAGVSEPGANIVTVERFDRASGAFATLPSTANLSMATYPRMFQLPDGRLVRVGQERGTMFFDPTTASWATGPSMVFGQRIRGSAVMLPDERILMMGGAATNSGATTATTEILDLGATAPTWRATAPMEQARRNFNAVLLPDGTVFAVGGNQGTGFYNSPVLTPELFDPATELWTPMAPHTAPRAYHSTAALLPDGRVLAAGQNDGTMQTTLEIYSPPYLFAGPRPVIGSAPDAVSYGESFPIATTDAATVDDAVLIRASSSTHGVNFDQRSVELHFTAGSDALQATAPASGSEAPPGWYMLFLVRDGVPSVAEWVQVGG
jgi:hypothetical protein